MGEILYQFKMYHEILGPKQNYGTYEIIVNQSIIRCNYANKLSY
jgi:hypothetical protein